MKQMKFLMVALVVLMGVSLTSCLNGDESTIRTGSEIVKVNQYDIPISFTNAAGIKLIPDKAISSTNGKMALIYYQFDYSQLKENTEKVQITLLADPKYIDGTPVRIGSSEDITENAPMVTLEPSTGYGTLKGVFFDSNMLIVPIGYKVRDINSQEEANNEIARHAFTLVYDSTQPGENGTLKLRLYHGITDPEGETVTRTKDAYDYKAYDLSGAILDYRVNNNDTKPTKVSIVIMQNRDNNKLDLATEETYTYDYKFTD